MLSKIVYQRSCLFRNFLEMPKIVIQKVFLNFLGPHLNFIAL